MQRAVKPPGRIIEWRVQRETLQPNVMFSPMEHAKRQHETTVAPNSDILQSSFFTKYSYDFIRMQAPSVSTSALQENMSRKSVVSRDLKDRPRSPFLSSCLRS